MILGVILINSKGLDKTKDKTSLIEWRKRVGETKANEIATEAASIGTRMHKFLEDYVEELKQSAYNSKLMFTKHSALFSSNIK